MKLKPSLWADSVQLCGQQGRRPVGIPINERAGGFGPVAGSRIAKVAAARAGLPGSVSAYWLRCAHVSHVVDRSAPAHLVQAIVGHASLATTSRYAHARPSDSPALYLAE